MCAQIVGLLLSKIRIIVDFGPMFIYIIFGVQYITLPTSFFVVKRILYTLIYTLMRTLSPGNA
jgi:hypothetical protein